MKSLLLWGLLTQTPALFGNAPGIPPSPPRIGFALFVPVAPLPKSLRLIVHPVISTTDAGSIKGTVRAVAIGTVPPQSTPLSGVKLTLMNKASQSQPITTYSNASGDFIFDNLPSGSYTLTIEANGLGTVSKDLILASGASLTVDVDMSATLNESVTIHDEEGLLSTSETVTSNVVRAETLKAQPLRTETYQASISLTPGVIRDGNGNDYLKGTRAGQSAYTVNGADVTDPGTGKPAFEIPLEAAASVQIQENPYSAEFGRFSGGVTNLQTKGGTDKFKISAVRFFPTFRNNFSSTVDSFRPRLTLSGPIVQKRFYYLQSFEYRFTRSFVPSLPKGQNDVTLEGFSSFTQFDWVINKKNSLKFNLAVFPQKIRNLNLDTFNPEPSTPNYKQRGKLFSVSEQAVLKDSSFLLSAVSYKTFDVDVFAKSDRPFNVFPEISTGGYYADTRRTTKRVQWQETYYSRPLKFRGDHLIKAGIEFDETSIGGQLRYSSVFIRRLDTTLARRIDFTDSSPLEYGYREISGFLQDKWVLSPKVAFDYGIRFDRDGVTGRGNFSPRFSFLFQPYKNGKTVVRGGIGIFYDRSLAAAGYFDRQSGDDTINPRSEFEQVPERIVTDLAADGTTISDGPRRYETRLGVPFQTPRSIRWSIQLDQALSKSLTGRVGFLQRFTDHDLLIDPVVGAANTGELVLSSRGHSRYDEFQMVLVYNKAKLGQWNFSYVFSHARGDLNTADRYFGNMPAIVVAPNEYGPLPFDSPHRFLFYGQIDVSKKHDVRVAPLFEVRSGFPFSKVNDRMDFVGPQNEAGRFPLYLSLDIQVSKGIQLPFFLKDKRARIGAAVFNVTNHFNPRDVQMNMTSPNFGQFYNSLGAGVKAKFDMDF